MDFSSNIFMTMFLLICIKIQLAKLASICNYCTGNARSCEENSTKINCNQGVQDIVLEGLSPIFENMPVSKLNKYDCFKITFKSLNPKTNGRNFRQHFGNCIAADISICNLKPTAELVVDACQQCSDNNCNADSDKAEDKSNIRIRRNNNDLAKRESSVRHTETSSIIFCVIVMAAVIICISAYAIARIICRYPNMI